MIIKIPEGDGGQLNVLSWCVCRKCRLMPIIAHNKCCRQRECVTNSSGFDNLVIDSDTLNTAIVHRIDFFAGIPGYSPASYHKAAIGSTSYGSMGI